MKSIPMTFNSKMVNAIIGGQKTVTRRQLSSATLRLLQAAKATGEISSFSSNLDKEYVLSLSPYKCEDLIYVRETWGVVSHDYDENDNIIEWTPNRPSLPIKDMKFGNGYYSGNVIYRADDEFLWQNDYGDDISAWKPSIHMPKIASRITLKVKSVSLEKLQDITEVSAIQEGMSLLLSSETLVSKSTLNSYQSPITSFKTLWNDIYDNWDNNPYVWIVEFDVINANVNAVTPS